MTALTTPENIFRFALGLTILLAGRNVFWLFVAAVGFLIAYEVARGVLVNQPIWIAILASIAIGVGGALIAIFFQRLGFALAGFYAAAFICVAFTGVNVSPPAVFAIGIVGAVLAALLTDWAIIILSALAGAAAIASIVASTPAVQFAVIVVLGAIGIAVQSSVMAAAKPF